MDGTILIWNTTNWNLNQTLKGFSHQIWSVAFSPDGTVLAVGSSGHDIIIFEKRLNDAFFAVNRLSRSGGRLYFGDIACDNVKGLTESNCKIMINHGCDRKKISILNE